MAGPHVAILIYLNKQFEGVITDKKWRETAELKLYYAIVVEL